MMGKFKEHYDGPGLNLAAIEQDYLEYLCGIVGTLYLEDEYWRLLQELHGIPFYWDEPLDVNRCADGLNLRILYLEDTGLLCRLKNNECTVLEMLIGVAFRMDDMTEEHEVGHFFWEIIGNLGLLDLTDDEYYHRDGSIVVMDIIDTMLSRRFARNGAGGMFPLASSRKDQRIRDIWYQMNVYMIENYDPDGYI